jgi:hypothetical protein
MPKILIAVLALVILAAAGARAQQVYGHGQNQMHTNEPGGPLLFGGPQSQWHTDRLGGPMILGPTVGGCNDCESDRVLDDNEDD